MPVVDDGQNIKCDVNVNAAFCGAASPTQPAPTPAPVAPAMDITNVLNEVMNPTRTNTAPQKIATLGVRG